jgi:cysteine desulfurase
MGGMSKSRRIYLDTAAATPLDPRVAQAMRPLERRLFGNATSLHAEGVAANRALDAARAKIASLLGARPDEIIFTSGGTESNNLILRGLGGPFVTSAIEHSSVRETARTLEQAGTPAIYLPVDEHGLIAPRDLRAALARQPETKLISLIYAQNEIGTIQDIRELAKVIRDFRKSRSAPASGSPFPVFHLDACQAARFLELRVSTLGVDALSLNAAKIYGPKGVGLLYVRRGINLVSLATGGGQEGGRRSGTENVAGAVGLAAALELAVERRATESKKLNNLRTGFIKGLLAIPGVTINGAGPEQLPHLVNVTLPLLSAEQWVLELDARGVACSAGAACAAARAEASYVIMALGRSEAAAERSLRFSFDRSTTAADLRFVLNLIKTIVQKYNHLNLN